MVLLDKVREISDDLDRLDCHEHSARETEPTAPTFEIAQSIIQKIIQARLSEKAGRLSMFHSLCKQIERLARYSDRIVLEPLADSGRRSLAGAKKARSSRKKKVRPLDAAIKKALVSLPPENRTFNEILHFVRDDEQNELSLDFDSDQSPPVIRYYHEGKGCTIERSAKTFQNRITEVKKLLSHN